MTLFASRENSLAEQRALEQLIVDTFDAKLKDSGGATGTGTAPAGGSTVPAPPEKPPEEPARPNWEQRLLWDAA